MRINIFNTIAGILGFTLMLTVCNANAWELKVNSWDTTKSSVSESIEPNKNQFLSISATYKDNTNTGIEMMVKHWTPELNYFGYEQDITEGVVVINGVKLKAMVMVNPWGTVKFINFWSGNEYTKNSFKVVQGWLLNGSTIEVDDLVISGVGFKRLHESASVDAI